MFATRGMLHSLFGLDAPIVLDLIAVALLAYAGALGVAARRPSIGRRTLMAFTAADATWVAASALVLLLFRSQLAPLAQVLVIAVGLVVGAFAALQLRAAGLVAGAAPPARSSRASVNRSQCSPP